MSAHLRWLAWAWAGLAACSGDHGLFLERQGRSLILAELGADSALSLSAYALGPGAKLAFERPFDGPTFYALSYEATLESMGLDEGPIVLGGNDPLPEPDHIAIASTLDEEPAWSELREMPDALREIRVSRSEHCVDLAVRQGFVLPESTGLYGRFAVSLGPDRAFLHLVEGLSFLIEESGPRLIDNMPQDRFSTGAYSAVSDELWLFGTSGKVWHGHPDRGFAAAPDPPLDAPAVEADASQLGAFELDVVTSTMSVFSFDGAHWRRRTAPQRRSDDLVPIQIAHSGPGKATVIGGGNQRVLELDGDLVRESRLGGLDTGLEFDGIQSVHFLHDWGVVIGSRKGVLLQNDGSGYVQLGPKIGGSQYVVAQLGQSLLAGGEDGVLTQVKSDRNLCESGSYQIVQDTPFVFLLPLGRGLAAFPLGVTPQGYWFALLSD